MPTPKEIKEEAHKISRFAKDNRVKKELVTLGGLALTTEGKLTKSNYFEFLGYDLDRYDDIVMTSKQAASLSNYLRHLSTGASAMTPLMCGGALCPFATRCPLVQMKHAEDPEERGHPQHGKAPVGKQCILEVQLIKEWIVRYFEEFDIDPNNFTEVGYISELADLMVLEMRANMNLAKVENANLIVDQTVGVDREGDPIIQKVISPFLEMKERIASRRSKIIKLMVGDRQEKYKKEAALKIKLDSDTSSIQADMRQRLENLKRDLDSAEDRLLTDKAAPTPGTLSPMDLMHGDEPDASST